jgi:hypothetical protein
MFLVEKKEAGICHVQGSDKGGDGKIIARNEDYIAVKWPSHKYWVGIGMDRQYASPRIEIFKMIADNMDGNDGPIARHKVQPAISWEVTKGK